MNKGAPTVTNPGVAVEVLVTQRRTFDEAWADLTPRLAAVLAARGVHAQDRDDILQDTALRLYRVWDSLATDQPVWPYAVTIALNLWRDSLRHKVPQPTELGAGRPGDAADELDVERTVIARHELARVGAALRQLAPEQRNLLLMNEELAEVGRPLEPAERMARMRVRRELAKVVGRASAALGLLWLRRPARSDGFATAACVGMLAATVMTGSQLAPAAGAPTHAPSLLPAAVTIAPTRAVAMRNIESGSGRPDRLSGRHFAHAAHQAPVVVCPPAEPAGAPKAGPVVTQALTAVSSVESTVSIVEAPPMQADSESGCVQVG